ncbi:MAG: hypothetical protein WCB12_07480 [Bryobacteraceae bacterium]
MANRAVLFLVRFRPGQHIAIAERKGVLLISRVSDTRAQRHFGDRFLQWQWRSVGCHRNPSAAYEQVTAQDESQYGHDNAKNKSTHLSLPFSATAKFRFGCRLSLSTGKHDPSIPRLAGFASHNVFA